jgi:hypothetical protein
MGTDLEALEVVRAILDGVETTIGLEEYALGYVVYKDGMYDASTCTSWLSFPAVNLVNHQLLGALYFIALLYIFVGIFLMTEPFLAAIEMIVSKRVLRNVRLPDGTLVKREVDWWNPTMANLTSTFPPLRVRLHVLAPRRGAGQGLCFVDLQAAGTAPRLQIYQRARSGRGCVGGCESPHRATTARPPAAPPAPCTTARRPLHVPPPALPSLTSPLAVPCTARRARPTPPTPATCARPQCLEWARARLCSRSS